MLHVYSKHSCLSHHAMNANLQIHVHAYARQRFKRTEVQLSSQSQNPIVSEYCHFEILKSFNHLKTKTKLLEHKINFVTLIQ